MSKTRRVIRYEIPATLQVEQALYLYTDESGTVADIGEEKTELRLVVGSVAVSSGRRIVARPHDVRRAIEAAYQELLLGRVPPRNGWITRPPGRKPKRKENTAGQA